MNTETTIEPMATRVELHPFFLGLNRHYLALLTDCAISVHFEPGEVLLREGDFANRFYVIETGKVILESRSAPERPAVIVDTIGTGDLVGWSWMFTPYAWRFTARAVEPTDAIYFHGDILREYCEKDPTLGYELLKRMTPVMTKRLQAARETMLSINAGRSVLPLLTQSPFMDQELDIDCEAGAELAFREGAD